jgi:hypothetical protein
LSLIAFVGALPDLPIVVAFAFVAVVLAAIVTSCLSGVRPRLTCCRFATDCVMKRQTV